jgi:thymidine kinase
MAPKICVFTGPMFAGKTSKIIECWNSTNLPKYAFKFISDIRYEQNIQDRKIVSHNENKMPAIGISKCIEITDYINTNEPDIVIFIDEGQFLHDIYQWIFELAPKNISQIFISGLDYDIFGNHFSEEFAKLITDANECHTLTAKCFKCQSPACYTQFIDNNSIMRLDGNILIGGSEQYQPVCHNHFEPITK